MDQPLTSQQLLHNSYHLSIRSSLLAIQCILSRQETILQSNHYTVVDLKSAISFQNATLQRITKTLAETFPKISSYKPPLPEPRSTPSVTVPAGSPPKMAPTATTSTGTISTATPTSTTATSSITSLVLAPPKSTLPSYIPPSPENINPTMPQQVCFHPPDSEPANNQCLQPNQPEQHIGDSVMNKEKSRSEPPTNSETILHPSNLDSIQKLDLKAATPLGYSKYARVYAGVIAHIRPQFSLKAWSSTVDESYGEERKSALDDAHNMFAEMNKLKLKLAAAPTVFVEMHKMKCESKVLVFDPGGTFNLEKHLRP